MFKYDHKFCIVVGAFMKKKYTLDNGFIPRQPGNQLGNLQGIGVKKSKFNAPNKLIVATGDDTTLNLGQTQINRELGRIDIDESLDDIDAMNNSTNKPSRKQLQRLAKQVKRPRSLIVRLIKWLIVIILIVAIGAGGYVAYKFINVGNSVFQGSIFDIFKNQQLKQDSRGRSNFLILGTSEDDPGHEGASLTDSIMVVSVDQTNKNIYMFSVPRDMLVEYGEACNAGYSGKINEYFNCVNDGTTKEDEQDRLSKTQKFIGDIFGIDIQYGIHANYTVMKQAVDAVSGIDVNIQGSFGAPGILDRAFDYRCNYTCYLVNYDNGIYHLDGQQALDLARARGDDNGYPTYGLSRSNPDREMNQQKILVALKDKATSTGILSNLSAVTKLINSLGDNLRSNIQIDEIRTIMQIASEIKSSDIHTLDLVSDGVMSDAGNPSAGIYNYDAIKMFIKKKLVDNPVSREAAPVVVLNGTNAEGFAQSQADILTEIGFNVSLIDNAPEDIHAETEIYQIGAGNLETANKLSEMFNVTIKNAIPPLAVDGDVRFVVVLGDATS